MAEKAVKKQIELAFGSRWATLAQHSKQQKRQNKKGRKVINCWYR